MITSEYIIDFDRLNQLTVHPHDNPNNTGTVYGGVSYYFSITRKIIKEYMDIYMCNSPKISPEAYMTAIETLRYNKILLDKSDIRDNKINIVLKKHNTTHP